LILTPLVLTALAGTGVVGGFVDAVPGGGSLISLPVLLSVGLPPVAALGTNKVQSMVGTAIAAATYWRKGFADLRALAGGIAVMYVASFCGAAAVRQIDVSVLTVAVPVALIAIAVYFLLSPRMTDENRRARLPWTLGVPVMGAIIGFYDGAFGPGTGSFLTLGFVALFGLGVTRAAGSTKALNLASNLGALTLFIPSGDVLWPAALAMAVGQLVGGYLGALTGIRFGAKLIRPLVVVISLVLAGRMLFFR
jgi:uncharacterized protein